MLVSFSGAHRDVNEAPTINATTNLTVYENVPFGFAILPLIRARDQDANSIETYRAIIPPSALGTFVVSNNDTLSGMVTVVGSVDYERVNFYTFPVRCVDCRALLLPW